MLYYIAKTLDRPDGGSRAAVDILLSILTTDLPVTVVSCDRCDIPPSVNSHLVTPPLWLTPPSQPRLPKPSRHFPKDFVQWAKESLQDPFRQRRFEGNLRHAEPRLVIHNGFPKRDSYAFNVLGSLGKSVMIVHSSPNSVTFYSKNDKSMTIDWVLESMQACLALIFVSSRCKEEWLAFEALKGKLAYYIPNCCREDAVETVASQDRGEVRQRLGFKDQFAVVCAASFQPRKGQDVLVEALPELTAVAPDLHLYFVGDNRNDWGATLQERAAGLGHAGRTHFLGLRSDALDHIRAADLLILPSRAEALPLTILEAMALETPVVATDIDGIPELIEDGASGLLFPADDREGLVKAFTRIYQDKVERGAFVEHAHARYWAHFSRAQHLRRYREAIDQLRNWSA